MVKRQCACRLARIIRTTCECAMHRSLRQPSIDQAASITWYLGHWVLQFVVTTTINSSGHDATTVKNVAHAARSDIQFQQNTTDAAVSQREVIGKLDGKPPKCLFITEIRKPARYESLQNRRTASSGQERDADATACAQSCSVVSKQLEPDGATKPGRRL